MTGSDNTMSWVSPGMNGLTGARVQYFTDTVHSNKWYVSKMLVLLHTTLFYRLLDGPFYPTLSATPSVSYVQ